MITFELSTSIDEVVIALARPICGLRCGISVGAISPVSIRAVHDGTGTVNCCGLANTLNTSRRQFRNDHADVT